MMFTKTHFARAVAATLALSTCWALNAEAATKVVSRATTIPGMPGVVAKRSGVQPMASANALTEFYAASGHVYASIDGLGSNDASGTIDIDKHSSTSTVRAAYLLVASTGFTGYVPTTSDITINGSPIALDSSTLIANSISSYNIRADITDLIKPLVDAAAPGRTTLTVSEMNTYSIDGEIIAVVFDDPAEPVGTVSLNYGAQSTTGDSFNVLLATPINQANPDQSLTMSLGISYGYQVNGYSGQYSTIDVNGVRLTSAAGGQDDGQPTNGALITVGGLDDSTANPPDPYAAADWCGNSPACDDELYDLKAMLTDGATSAAVDTLNPSNDDNIFFAAIMAKGTSAVVNEGILLTPDTQTVPVGTATPVVAVVQDSTGKPVVGTSVSFLVENGPDANLTGSIATDASGDASFTIPCATAGTDTVIASFVDNKGVTKSSNEVTVVCEKPIVIATQVIATTGSLSVVDHYTYALTVGAQLSTATDGTALAGQVLSFTGINGEAICAATTDASGYASCTGNVPRVWHTYKTGFDATFAGSGSYLTSTGHAGYVFVKASAPSVKH